MNVTVYPKAYFWLFGQCKPEQTRLWSFGRHEPPCSVGDDLLFRFDGTPVARAIVRWTTQPGEYDCEMFDGSRTLKGWKLAWLQRDFEDLRETTVPAMFGKPLSRSMEELLFCASVSGGRIAATQAGYRRALKGLIDRGFARSLGNVYAVLSLEGWRRVLRVVNERRVADIQEGKPLCRICGCTPNDACEGGCSWTDVAETLCSQCASLALREEVLA